ncbi:hypothetical protein ACFY4H_18010 [Streptomyces althioticus]|uniref:hypothetical protein n=1 Tax=Streptomyces althioticus TaxID=83380 RepID=UPI0036A6E225
MTVAVAALSGCVTVQRPLAPGPATAPPPGSGHDAAGRDASPVAQAPAREALRRVPADPEASPSDRATPKAAPSKREVPSDARNGQAPRTQRPRGPERPQPARRAPAPRPPAQLPGGGPLTGGASGGSDVCALGREYGGWPADSPQARICRDTYGR